MVALVDRGLMTPNEYRALFNMAPYEGGDEFVLRLDTSKTGDVSDDSTGKETKKMAKTVELPNSCCYKVYCHRNKINGKKYFGITSKSLKERWVNGKNYKGSTHFNHAIEKYGWDGFEHILIYSGCSKKVAEEIEKDLIETFDTRNPEKGYNIREGGNTSHHSEETKRKISIIKKQQAQSEEYRRKLSESHKGIPAYNKGVPMSEDQKKKVSEAKKGVPVLKRRKQVFCVELNKWFLGLEEAHEETGANISKICEVCKGTRKTAGGYHWTYERN